MKTLIALLLMAAPLAAQTPVTQTASANSRRTATRPGDGILLEVRNEPTLTDTFTVSPQYTILLPTIGAVSVAGVARDDLTRHLTLQLGKYLRHPEVQAKVLLRVGVVGEVARPGFYQMPIDAAFADALMLAGGPTKDAKVKQINVQRNERVVLDASQTHKALSDNSTINSVALQAGDMITVPRMKPPIETEAYVRMAALLVSIPVAYFTISRMR